MITKPTVPKPDAERSAADVERRSSVRVSTPEDSGGFRAEVNNGFNSGNSDGFATKTIDFGTKIIDGFGTKTTDGFRNKIGIETIDLFTTNIVGFRTENDGIRKYTDGFTTETDVYRTDIFKNDNDGFKKLKPAELLKHLLGNSGKVSSGSESLVPYKNCSGNVNHQNWEDQINRRESDGDHSSRVCSAIGDLVSFDEEVTDCDIKNQVVNVDCVSARGSDFENGIMDEGLCGKIDEFTPSYHTATGSFDFDCLDYRDAGLQR